MKNILIFYLLLFSSSLVAFQPSGGPDVILVTGSTLGSNGLYTKNVAVGNTVGGCACYENATNFIRFVGASWTSNVGTCLNFISNIETVTIGGDCDVTAGIPPIHNDQLIVRAYIRPIPTISQWGLIVLSLSFLILGAIRIKRRVFVSD